MDLTLSMTTAPRPIITIGHTINSLRRNKFTQPIHVFAEPDSPKPQESGLIWHQNNTKQGQFKNWRKSLQYLSENTDTPYYALIQDDFIVSRKAYQEIQTLLPTLNNDKLGFVTLYMATYHKTLLKGMKKGFKAVRQPLNCLWGCTMFLVLTRQRLTDIIQHPLFISYKRPQNSDCLITQICQKEKWDMIIPCRSLVDHKGRHSTIGHTHGEMNKGYRFVS